MTKVKNVGNLPGCLKTFLTNLQFEESTKTEVWDCKYDEIVKKAQDEHLEAQVIIDKRDTGRSYLCALGASVRVTSLYGTPRPTGLNPVFYFSELDEPRRKIFQAELTAARNKVQADHKQKLANDKLFKESAREKAKEYRDGQTRPHKPQAN